MMRIPISIDTVLEYYDGIQLFIGLDSFGASYICLLVFDDEVGYERYLGVRISKKRINDLKHNVISLRSVYTQPEEDGCYFFLDCDENNEILAQHAKDGFKLLEEMLPEDGYVCHFPGVDDLIIQEQKRLSLPVFTIGVDDAKGTHSAPTDVTINLLQGASSLYDAVTKKTKNNKTYFIGSSAASINLHIAIETGQTNNIFGQVPPETEAAFIRIKKLLRNEVPVGRMSKKEYDAVKKIYSTVYEEGLALKYNFKVSEYDHTDNSVYIPSEDLRNYYNELSATEEVISCEYEDLIGAFVSCSIKNGKWQVELLDGKIVKGQQPEDNRIILEGVVISDASYSLHCKKENRKMPFGKDEINYSIETISELPL